MADGGFEAGSPSAIQGGANAKPFDDMTLHVIASEAKQSPRSRLEIASSLRSSQ